jgi:hypothetical protein
VPSAHHVPEFAFYFPGLLDPGVQPLGPSSWDDPDGLRTVLVEFLAATSPAGSPGGCTMGELLSAAFSSWVQDVAEAVNDGQRFSPIVASNESPRVLDWSA